MAYGINARELLASELEGMLTEMPLSKVRVAELCRRAGCSAPTFYYHFRDKYELAAWMFVGDFAAAFADRDPSYDVALMEASLANMERRAAFYAAVWDDRSQNSVAAYIQDFCVEMSEAAVRSATGAPMTGAQVLLAKYHAYGMTNLAMEWMAGGLEAGRRELAEMLVERTPAFLADALSEHEFRSEELLGRAQR